MGAINYRTSDFITIGYNCNYIDYETEDDFYSDIIQDYYDQAKETLKKEHFYYFHVSLEPGYYEGFSIDIEFNFSVCFDGYEDRQQAQKEITRLKAFLKQCINDFECCAVYPGWCTAYEDYKNSLIKLDAAVQEMRQIVRYTPTWLQYERKGA